jgi:hypothetical protein
MKKTDLDNLELILEKICENNESVFYKFFQDENGNPFGIKNDEEAERFFIRLTFEFESIGIAYYDSSSFVLSPVNNECLKFKDKGGFREYYKNLKNSETESNELIKKEKERQVIKDKIDTLTLQNLEYEKSIENLKTKINQLTVDNLRLGNWDIRFRLYIYIGSFILGLIFKYFIDKI